MLYGSVCVGHPVPAEAMAMANGINIPAVFHNRFTGVEEVYVEIRGYTAEVRGVPCYIIGKRICLERPVKQKKGKLKEQIRIPFSEEMWARLNYYHENAGQQIELLFEDEEDYLSIKFGQS